jgi:polysaccharide biosynthesis/export protein
MPPKVVALALLLCASGCATAPSLPHGQQAYQLFPPGAPDRPTHNYRIGPLDTISVTVFQEPELSPKGLQVDTAGKVFLPLVGEMQAAGKTPGELADDLSKAYSRRYLENPQVAVAVQDSVSQKVTVGGAVTEPGVFPIKGRTTLLDALAMAKGLSRTGRGEDVAVFRMVDGRRVGAVFDTGRIGQGRSPDPEIIGGDLIIVGKSGLRQAMLDVLLASPFISAVRP